VIRRGQFGAASRRAAFRPWTHSLWSADPIDIQLRQSGCILGEIQGLLLKRLLHLQRIELQLARVVARRRSRHAVRQIERDRRRLGLELHTGVGQLLAAIRIQSELLGSLLPDPPDPIRAALARVDALAADALDVVRSVSRRLHPPDWQALSLDRALRHLWESAGISDRYEVDFDAPPLPRDPDPEVKTLIYRAAQEALANIIRHSHATRVGLTLSGDSRRVDLTVRDNGVGFTRRFDAPHDRAGGLGLCALRQEAAEFGGRLLVRSTPQGTTLDISLPLATS
jgi:two-component system NarL family sensor kinase